MRIPDSNRGMEASSGEDVVGAQGPSSRMSLVRYPDARLRSVCQPVESFDSALRDVAEEMLVVMRQACGIGLAAPQVGLRQRLIVCRLHDCPLALTNLEVKDAAELRSVVEGCLSLPEVRVSIRRPERIRVTGYDVQGRRRSFGAVGLWARVIQHELDHLNGVLICDYHQPDPERCPRCALELPAVLVEERKHRSRPRDYQP